MKKILMLSAAVIGLTGLAMAQPAEAAGCLRGAIAGGVIGHYAGHHGLLGAGVGCAYEHHRETVRDRDMRYNNRY